MKSYSVQFYTEPIRPFIYWHSKKRYKSRQPASTRVLVMNSSSQQHMDLLLSLINVKLFNSFDGQPLASTIVFLPGFHSFFFRSLSLAYFFMPILLSKHLCASATLSLPRHSWRSDRHGESVGQQPWNKYGWSWVRWARIICFAICLCESVDVMTVVLPSPASPPSPRKNAWQKCTHTGVHKVMQTHTQTHTQSPCTSMHAHTHTQKRQRNTTCTVHT